MRMFLLLGFVVAAIMTPAVFTEIQAKPSVEKSQATSLDGAKRIIEDLGSRVIDLLKKSDLSDINEQQKTDDFYKGFIGIYKTSFDSEKISAHILGSVWHKMTPAQKDRFSILLPKRLSKKLREMLHSMDNQKTSTILGGSQDIKKVYVSNPQRGHMSAASTMVLLTKTTDGQDKKKSLEVIWAMLPNGLVYDVIVEGVSAIKIFQDEFRSSLSDIDDFLNNLEASIKR